MGFSTNSLQVETVTPEKAQQFLASNYMHNRPLRKHHVAFLANEMREGRFMSTAEIHLMYKNGEPVLVNGQHTCSAIIQYGKPVRVTVRKTLATEAGQIAMAYAFGHDTGLRRTFNDGVGAYNLEEQTGLGKDEIAAVATALRHIRLGFRSEGSGATRSIPKTSVAEIVEKVYEWAPYAKTYFDATRNRDRTIRTLAHKRAAMAMILVTFRYAREEAFSFWTGVFTPTGMIWEDARPMARRVLEESKGKPGTSSTTPERLSRQLARCWRAYLNGEKMGQAPKVIDENAPITILRTPYTGRQPEPPWWPDDIA